jgi:hypothetical protein
VFTGAKAVALLARKERARAVENFMVVDVSALLCLL